MKKTKSVLYNIYSDDLHPFQLKDEYERLLGLITTLIKKENRTCNVHMDVGQYVFEDYQTVAPSAFYAIHIVIAAPETAYIEQVVEDAIPNNIAYRHFDKYSVDENALTRPNSNMLDRWGKRQDKIRIYYNWSHKVYSTTQQLVSSF